MRFQLFGIPVKISFFFFSLLGFLFFTSSNPILIVGIFFVLLHELGHVFAMAFLGDKIALFEIKPFGVAIVKGNTLGMTFKKEVLVYFAGPLVNGVFAFTGYLLYRQNGVVLYGICAAVNLLLFLFNLLPVSVLDGGQLLKLFLVKKRGIEAGEFRFQKISTLFCFLLLLVALLLVVTKKTNVTILVTAVYLLAANMKS